MHYSLAGYKKDNNFKKKNVVKKTDDYLEIIMAKLHRSEGDINLSLRRKKWQKENLDDATQSLLKEDSRYFLKQSLSTPCLNGMKTCEGIYIEDLQGRRYMDFHGN
ncbi:MAG: hypothetical protein HOJ48_13335, partial [Desulfobacula sp.]|nr:hypothetical protein [Desulfobacula sp.]